MVIPMELDTASMALRYQTMDFSLQNSFLIARNDPLAGWTQFAVLPDWPNERT
jgi:hypothetical protein